VRLLTVQDAQKDVHCSALLFCRESSLQAWQRLGCLQLQARKQGVGELEGDAHVSVDLSVLCGQPRMQA